MLNLRSQKTIKTLKQLKNFMRGTEGSGIKRQWAKLCYQNWEKLTDRKRRDATFFWLLCEMQRREFWFPWSLLLYRGVKKRKSFYTVDFFSPLHIQSTTLTWLFFLLWSWSTFYCFLPLAKVTKWLVQHRLTLNASQSGFAPLPHQKFLLRHLAASLLPNLIYIF